MNFFIKQEAGVLNYFFYMVLNDVRDSNNLKINKTIFLRIYLRSLAAIY